MFGNIFNSLQFPEDKPKEEEEKQTTGLMSSPSPRPRARPEGMTTSLRPRARPIDDDDDDNTINKTLANTIREINNPAYDDEDGVVASPPGTPLNSVDAQQVLLNPNSLHSAYNTRMAQAGADFTVKMQKFRSAEVDSVLNYAEYTKNQNDERLDKSLASAREALGVPEEVLRPRARPKTAEEIQDLRKEQSRYTKLDSVRDVQQALNAAGIRVNDKPLVVDGIKGRNTTAAIKAFQEREGLKVDGIAGKNTKAALIRGISSEPEIREEELQPSIFDKPAQVGPDQMQVGFSADDAASLSTNLAYQEYLRRVEKELTPEKLKNLEEAEDIKVASIIGSIPVPEAIKKPLKDINMIFKAVFSPVGRNFINDMMFGGGIASQANPLTAIPILGRQRVAGAEVFSEDALNLMRQMVLDKGIIDKGSVIIGREVYGKGGLSVKQTGGASAKEIVKALAEGSDAINEIKLMLGQFSAKIDDNGDIIVNDQFNFNEIINPIDGKKYTPEKYEQAIKDGKFTEAEVLMNILKPLKDGELNYEMVRALGFVLGSRSYEDEDRKQGRLFKINLGPAVTRPRARGDN